MWTGWPAHRLDILLATLLLGAAFAATWAAASRLVPQLTPWGTMDAWFEADIPRVFANITNRFSGNSRANFHPLFTGLLFAPVYTLQHVLGLDAQVAVRFVLAALAGAWMAVFFAVLRAVGCRRTDAMLLCGLAASSGAVMFLFPIPESHPAASLSLLLALLLVAVPASRSAPEWIDVAVSAATMAVTITNWMAGLVATAVRRPWRRSLQISVNAFVAVVLLWTVQHAFMPSTVFFLGRSPRGADFLAPETRGLFRIVESFFFHSMVMPAIAVVDRPSSGEWPIMITQAAAPGSSGVWGTVALALWVVLLGLGIWALFRSTATGIVRITVGTLLAGQLALAILFGNETFLYSPNYLPLLVLLVALTTLTPLRRWVLALATMLMVAGGINNVGQWRRAASFFHDYPSLRFNADEARTTRPSGPWPTATRAFALSPKATRKFNRAFFFPGGSLSPALGDFGISVWTLDGRGMPVETSGDQPRADTRSNVTWQRDSIASRVEVATPKYRMDWSPAGHRRWRLVVTVADSARVALVVRSVGPQSRAVRHLAWDGRRLLVNGRWSVETDSSVAGAHLVDERTPQWLTDGGSKSSLAVESGWAAARLDLRPRATYEFMVSDTTPRAPVDILLGWLRPGMDGPRTEYLDPSDRAGR